MLHPLIEELANNNLDLFAENNNLLFKKYGDIAIFKYSRDKKDGSLTQRKSRGTIIDLKTNKVICSSFNGSMKLEEFKEKVPISECIVEENIEGTLLNVYFYENRWRVSTKFNINADESKFKSQKTFRQLFDSLLDITSLVLDKTFTYSFVLIHKDIRLVSPVSENKIYHIETTNNITGQKIFIDLGIPHPKILMTGDETISKNANVALIKSYDELVLNIGKLPWSSRGYMLFSQNREYNYSLINPNYLYVKNLVQNQSDIKYICLESLYYKKNSDEILSYFPEYKKVFLDIIDDLQKVKKNVYKLYVDKNCHKKIVNIPKKYNKVLFDVHGVYINNNKRYPDFRVGIEDVHRKLISYDCPYLYSILYKN